MTSLDDEQSAEECDSSNDSQLRGDNSKLETIDTLFCWFLDLYSVERRKENDNLVCVSRSFE